MSAPVIEQQARQAVKRARDELRAIPDSEPLTARDHELARVIPLLEAFAARVEELERDLTAWIDRYYAIGADLAAARRETDTRTRALLETRKRLWWFIERDGGDGGEIDTAEVAAEAMAIQHDVIDPALAAVPAEEGAAE